MLKQITKVGTEGFAVQKITKPNGELIRYQVVEKPGDASRVKQFDTLGEIYDAYGKPSASPSAKLKAEQTRMKDYPQNQSGYKASNSKRN